MCIRDSSTVGRLWRRAVRREDVADADGTALGRHEVGELGNRGQLQPVGEAFLPDVRVGPDLAALDARANVGLRNRTDLLALDNDVPSALGSRRGGRSSRLLLPFAAAHHDDVAALLAADLEDLSSN